MKAMACGLWQGAKRSNSCDYCEDEQRRHGPQDTFSCSGICEADHHIPNGYGDHGAGVADRPRRRFIPNHSDGGFPHGKRQWQGFTDYPLLGVAQSVCFDMGSSSGVCRCARGAW